LQKIQTAKLESAFPSLALWCRIWEMSRSSEGLCRKVARLGS